MDQRFLDELIVPAPPYRTARPVSATLAAEAPPPKNPVEKLPHIPPLEQPADLTSEQAAATIRNEISATVQRIAAEPIPTNASAEQRTRIEEAKKQLAEKLVALEELYTGASAPAVSAGPKPTPARPSPTEVGAAAKKVQEVVGRGGKVVELPGGTTVATYPNEHVEVLERGKSEVTAPTPAKREQPGPAAKKVGDIITEGKARARVVEVNAEGRPTRLETIEPTPAIPVAPVAEIGKESVNIPITPELRKQMDEATAQGLERERVARAAENVEPSVPVERPHIEPENPSEHALQKEEEAERMPLREHIGPFDYVRGALDWAVEKSGTKPWLDTLAPRLESAFHRQMAEMRMMQQVRAQGLLNRADNKLENWEATAKDAGWPMKLFYANRVRAWQKHANACEARVDTYESIRHRWQERHNDLQKQVSERYERELEPYRELATALKSKEAAAMDVWKNLSALRHDALKKLSVAKADAGKRSGIFMSSRTRRAIKEIEQEVKDLERLEAQADKSVAKARAPLARAQAEIDTWELKRKTVAQRMKFPEAAGLTRPKRTIVEIPPQAGIATTAGPEQPVTAEGPSMEQRMAEEWQPAEFVKRWNAYNVDLAIEKADEFSAFVASERTRLRQQGVPTRQQLLDLVQSYQQLRLSPKVMKKFKTSSDLFAAKINKE